MLRQPCEFGDKCKDMTDHVDADCERRDIGCDVISRQEQALGLE